ncbi:MAG: tetratricopeptide repeat protein [Nitrospirae bacterium]|nr:tetratricopeptide repeat protein [Nitrospirota bacterium]
MKTSRQKAVGSRQKANLPLPPFVKEGWGGGSNSQFRTPTSEFNMLLSLCFLLFTIHCSLFLTGCGHATPAPSGAHLQAVEFNQRAETDFKKGDYKSALNFYNEALRINRSIENNDGIAINLINLAIVYHKLGDKDNALKHVNEILDTSLITHNALRQSEAAIIKAMIYLEDADYGKASQWADSALSFCKGIECAVEGKIYNIKSRIALLKGDFSPAAVYAAKGLDLNKEHKDREETANSLRLIATTKAKAGEYEGAKKSFEDALAIDKSLGASRKIILDLMGAGDILFKQGVLKDALRYYNRALSASEGAGDKQGIKDAAEMIEKCQQDLKKK